MQITGVISLYEKLVFVYLFLETSYVMVTSRCMMVSARAGHFEKQIEQQTKIGKELY